MIKLHQTKIDLATLLSTDPDRSVGLFFSGGSDSLLLLHILMDMNAKFSIVCFDHTFTREQRQQIDEIIERHDLRMFSYAPSNAYLMGDDTQVSLVEEYQMYGLGTLPFIRDCVQDETRCAVEDVKLGPWLQTPVAPIGFEINLVGSRKGDRHYITGTLNKSAAWSRGPFECMAPLWEWTRKDVKEGLRYYDVRAPKLDTGNLPMCLNCLCGTGQVYCPKTKAHIPAIDWDPKAMAEEFKTKYGYL